LDRLAADSQSTKRRVGSAFKRSRTEARHCRFVSRRYTVGSWRARCAGRRENPLPATRKLSGDGGISQREADGGRATHRCDADTRTIPFSLLGRREGSLD